MIPLALGLPSTRIGFPPMYLDSMQSKGCRVWLYVDAAAIEPIRYTQFISSESKSRQRIRTLRKPIEQSLKLWTRVRVP